MKNSDILVVRLPEQLKRDLEEVAKISRRSVSDYVRLLIEDAIKRKERK